LVVHWWLKWNWSKVLGRCVFWIHVTSHQEEWWSQFSYKINC
jgi:hypothetical protein